MNVGASGIQYTPVRLRSQKSSKFFWRLYWPYHIHPMRVTSGLGKSEAIKSILELELLDSCAMISRVRKPGSKHPKHDGFRMDNQRRTKSTFSQANVILEPFRR